MENLNQYINECGEKAVRPYHIEISNVEYDDNEASFEIDNIPLFAKISWCFDQDGGSGEYFVDLSIKELHTVIQTSNGRFVPFQIHAHSDFGFSITAIENLIASTIFDQEKSKAEDNYWNSLIDSYESSKY